MSIGNHSFNSSTNEYFLSPLNTVHEADKVSNNAHASRIIYTKYQPLSLIAVKKNNYMILLKNQTWRCSCNLTMAACVDN